MVVHTLTSDHHFRYVRSPFQAPVPNRNRRKWTCPRFATVQSHVEDPSDASNADMKTKASPRSIISGRVKSLDESTQRVSTSPKDSRSLRVHYLVSSHGLYMFQAITFHRTSGYPVMRIIQTPGNTGKGNFGEPFAT